MGLAQYFILILCFASVLPKSINILKSGENETPFIEIGSKYYIINTGSKMNWFSALLYCRNYDSDLAVIESETEMNALSFYLTTNGHLDKKFWLGLTDLVEEGKFISLKDGRPPLYAKWSVVGDDPKENCVLLWPFDNIFRMTDSDCMAARHYAICELRQPKKTCDLSDLKNFMESFMQHTNVTNGRN